MITNKKYKKMLFCVLMLIFLMLCLPKLSVYAAKTKTITSIERSNKLYTSKEKLSVKAKKSYTKKVTSKKTSKKVKRYTNKTVSVTTETTTTIWKTYKKKSKVVLVKKKVSKKITTKTKIPVKSIVAISGSAKPTSVLTSDMNKKMVNLLNILDIRVKSDTSASYAGRTNIYNMTITLRNKKDKSTFLHECGHILWYFSWFKNQDSLLHKYYLAERDNYDLFNKDYITADENEFFAECYKLYELNDDYLKENLPKMYNLVRKCLNNIMSKSEIVNTVNFLASTDPILY